MSTLITDSTRLLYLAVKFIIKHHIMIFFYFMKRIHCIHYYKSVNLYLLAQKNSKIIKRVYYISK